MISAEYITRIESIIRDLTYEDFLPLNYVQLAGDGSPRRFYRLFSKTFAASLILVIPERPEAAELAESRSAYLIGNHLLNCDVPVPEPIYLDEESGILIFEDLGDTRLQDCISNKESKELYRDTVVQLARMQCKAAPGFNKDWCWDTPRYDKQFMLERESDYFLSAFWQGLLQQQVPAQLAEEFVLLADSSAEAPAHYFLHLDFQSRNVMVKNGKVRIIDFQGGRLGPLAYDLASLLNDPYTGLPLEYRASLVDDYFNELLKHTTLSRQDFDKQFVFLGCQRNLQILGAFSYLSNVRNKDFFADFIKPSLKNLQHLLESEYLKELKVLKSTAEKAAKLLD